MKRNPLEKATSNSLHSYFGRLFRLLMKERPVTTVFWGVLIFLPATLPVVQIQLQKRSVDELALLSQGSGQLWWGMVLVASFYLLNVITVMLNSVENYLYTILWEDVGYHLKIKITEKVMSLPLWHFEDPRLYDCMLQAQTAISKNILDLIKYVLNSVSLFVSLISMIGVLAMTHWSLPIALFLSALPGIGLLILAKKGRFRLSVETTPAAREMDYTLRLLMRRESAKEIRLFHLGDYLLERWKKVYNEVRRLMLRQTVRESIGQTIGVFFLSLASGSVALILVSRIGGGKITIGDYVALTGAVTSLQALLGNLGMNIGGIFEIGLHVKNLYGFIDSKTEITNIDAKEKRPFPKDSYSEIVVENLGFTYPNQERKVLEDISLTIKRGEIVAIVGGNGAGKSTLVNCLVGLYPISEGSIRFGEWEISEIDKESLWNHVSAVFQDFVRYSYTLRENVGFGQIDRLNQDEQVMQALYNAGIENIVLQIRDGLDGSLGLEFSGGQELSGGQWQRIAIARAFMREADILVFDEPTSALDPQAELEIFKCFVELSKGKTAIMISHRLGPASLADRIFVLKEGKLVEQGNHQQLMELDREYAAMFRAQAQWYQKPLYGSEFQSMEVFA